MDNVIHVMGVPRVVSDADRAVLETADLIVGSSRQCSLIPHPPNATTIDWSMGFDQVYGALTTANAPVVLASGDPGFFGIVRRLNQKFPSSRLNVLPAISSVASAFGMIGMPWTDAVVASAHGRDIRHAIALARAYPKVAVLTEPNQGAQRLFEGVKDLGRTVYVAADIGGPNEIIARHHDGDRWPDPNVVLIIDEEALAIENSPETEAPITAGQMPTPFFGLPEAVYEHRDGMITKAEVRAVALAWLAPGPGKVIWDIGCGSGSVSVEAASAGAAVFAVDSDPDQVARTRRNAATHQVTVQAISGNADTVINQWQQLIVADAAFIGGGGDAALNATVEAGVGRIVLTLAAIDRVIPVIKTLEYAGYGVRATQIQANRLEGLANGQRRLAALNPVTIIRAEKLVIP
ncbi:precorrin-6y C5,15-methyltransferase (decarboxylating) subunit CbiE [Stomatohabitans albus]|uniref:precorrin-6y C5,15-methyltransferase (decarboxylating) subunit CbiE n=1 Tax=Stomatohabitans albus TaxID=3110766 RepID=UPI00300CB07D